SLRPEHEQRHDEEDDQPRDSDLRHEFKRSAFGYEAFVRTRKKPLSEQVLVVTGASTGLGRAIARGAGERGAKVVVTARNAEALDNAVAEIEASGSEALADPADHAVQDEVAKVVEQAIDRFGRID